MSIGDAELVTVRPERRVPVMTIWSALTLAWLAPAPVLTFVGLVGAGCVVTGGAVSCALAASATNSKLIGAAEANRVRLNRCVRVRAMKSPQCGAMFRRSSEDA